MKSWYRIAECIFKAVAVSHAAHQAGMCVHPQMAIGPDGVQIVLEQKAIVAGWEVKN